MVDADTLERVNVRRILAEIGLSEATNINCRFKGLRHSKEEMRFFEAVGSIAKTRLGDHLNLQEWRENPESVAALEASEITRLAEAAEQRNFQALEQLIEDASERLRNFQHRTSLTAQRWLRGGVQPGIPRGEPVAAVPSATAAWEPRETPRVKIRKWWS